MNENMQSIPPMQNSEQPVYTPPVIPNTASPKPKIIYSKAEHIAAVCALIGGFLAFRLFLYHPAGLFTTLLCWAGMTLTLVFLKKTGRTLRRSDKFFAAVLYLFPMVFSISANLLLRVLTTMFLILGGGLFLFRTANPDADVLRFLPSSLIQSGFMAPFLHFPKAYTAAVSGTKDKAAWKNIVYIIIGLVIAVPVTVAAANQLIKADKNMSALLDSFKLIPLKSLTDLIPCFFFGLLIGAAVFSALYTAAHRSLVMDTAACEKKIEACRFVPNPVIYAAVTPLCILYILFFISQLQYLTGGFTGETSGFTYAEYARRGFFELCRVCCINLFVLAGMGFFARISGAVKPAILRIYSCFLCISSLVLAGTALAKMGMYIQIYGMTRLRIYTTWFMLLLVIGFGAILVRQFVPTLNLGRLTAVVFTVLFGLLCFSRPDAWITRYNAEMYLSGNLEDFDTTMLSNMSDDAWAALAVYDDEELNRLSGYGIHLKTEIGSRAKKNDFWESMNFSAQCIRPYAAQTQHD